MDESVREKCQELLLGVNSFERFLPDEVIQLVDLALSYLEDGWDLSYLSDEEWEREIAFREAIDALLKLH